MGILEKCVTPPPNVQHPSSPMAGGPCAHRFVCVGRHRRWIDQAHAVDVCLLTLRMCAVAGLRKSCSTCPGHKKKRFAEVMDSDYECLPSSACIACGQSNMWACRRRNTILGSSRRSLPSSGRSSRLQQRCVPASQRSVASPNVGMVLVSLGNLLSCRLPVHTGKAEMHHAMAALARPPLTVYARNAGQQRRWRGFRSPEVR